MEVKKEKRIHTVLSNVFYYSFVSLVIAILILSLVLEDSDLILDILFISLLVSTVVIVFYLTVQMLRYNLSVNKKAQIGIFLVVIGFLLILFSTGKQITLGDHFILNFLGDTFFVYWGIGSIALGIFIELTFIDQFLWDAFKKPFIFLWKKIVSFVKWFGEHWLKILLYSLDIVAIGGIITIAVLWPLLDWWKIAILSVCCLYPIVHHSKRIWRVIKYIAVDMIYAFIKVLYNGIKQILKAIWEKIVTFFTFIAEHWWTILKEILRLIGVAGGITIIYFGEVYPQYWYLLIIGIATIIFSQFFTRKVVLQGIWNTFVRFVTFIWDMLVAFFTFIAEHWWTILKEFLRLVGVAGGIALIYFGIQILEYRYFVWLGISAIILSEFFTRKIMLNAVWEGLTNLANFIWDSVKFFGESLWKIVKAIYNFIVDHLWAFTKEFLRLAGVAGGIVLIYFGYTRIDLKYLIGIGIVVIIVSAIFTRKIVLAKTWELISNFFIFIWEKIIKPYYKRVINEVIRLLFVAGGLVSLYYAFTLDSQQYWYLFLIGFLTILLAEIILRKPVLLKLKEIIVNFALFFWEIFLIVKRPFIYLGRIIKNIFIFIKDHLFKVLLYTLDFATLGVILYFSFTFTGSWWHILILAVSSAYIPCHHYKTIWKILRFIVVDMFYNPVVRIAKAIKSVFVKIWETLDAIFKFISEHWRIVIKEIVRFAGMIGGFVLIYYGAKIQEYWYFILLGIVAIIFFQLLTRKKVVIKIYELFKSIIVSLYKRRSLTFRILGLGTVIVGIVLGFQRNWNIESIITMSIGGAFLLFSHIIFHPIRFWEFLKKIPKYIGKVFVTIWLTFRSVFGYIGDNFLTLLLLSIVIFSFVYGISLILTIIQPYFDFLGVFPAGFSVPIMIFIGAGLIVMALVAIIILRWRGELKKLRTGRSKKLADQIKELWDK